MARLAPQRLAFASRRPRAARPGLRPPAPGGGVFIEAKTRTGRLSEDQHRWRKVLEPQAVWLLVRPADLPDVTRWLTVGPEDAALSALIDAARLDRWLAAHHPGSRRIGRLRPARSDPGPPPPLRARQRRPAPLTGRSRRRRARGDGEARRHRPAGLTASEPRRRRPDVGYGQRRRARFGFTSGLLRRRFSDTKERLQPLDSQ